MKKKLSNPATPESCQFSFADGRQCRMPRHHNHPSLCLFHAGEEQQLLESRRLGTEIAATLTGDFLTASDVNYVLGKLFTALAQNRIPQRNAHTLAYIGALLLHSISDVSREIDCEYSYEGWQNMIKNAVRLSQAAWPGLRSHASPEGNGAAPVLGTPKGN
jgi:hypothetical protein